MKKYLLFSLHFRDENHEMITTVIDNRRLVNNSEKYKLLFQLIDVMSSVCFFRFLVHQAGSSTSINCFRGMRFK